VNEGTITVSLGDRSYDIFFAKGMYPLFREWVNRFFPGTPVFVVTDRTVFSLYGDDIRNMLSGVPHEILTLPPGEEGKNWETVQEIYSFLSRGGAGRDSLAVAFGGGVVGDLAGFAAATFLRGIPYVQVPTTLLSQVDSSVGGKTGFNLAEGKNLVGAFHQPRAVFIDPDFLLTLDVRNLRAGMAEVVKCAFAGSPSLLETITDRTGIWKEMSSDSWITVIRNAVAFKAGVVERDEKEASARRILNLGHTIGHALEQASGYGQLLHGEAVAMGLAWEAVFSRRQGTTPPALERRVIDLLLDMGFSLDDPGVTIPAISEAIGMDKKKLVSDIDMPLLTGPGSCVLTRIPVSLLREDLPAVREKLRGFVRDRVEAAARAETPVRKEEDLRDPPVDVPASAELSISELERRVVVNPRDLGAMIALSEAYRHAGNLAGAWDTIKEVLDQDPSSASAQRVARDIEQEVKESLPDMEKSPSPLLEEVLILEEGAFELRSADLRPDSVEGTDEAGDSSLPEPGTPVRTVTMATVYWEQGKQEEAMQIIDEILMRNPRHPRALSWLESREEMRAKSRGESVVSSLTAFLKKMTKEFGYDLPRHH
jgi:3-dehydroquinate synthase